MANSKLYNGLTIYGNLEIDGNFIFPSTDGSNGQVMVTDGAGNVSWVNMSGGTSGGTGSPAGSNTWVQYNDAGSFGATSGLTWDGASAFTVDTTVSGKTQGLGIGVTNLMELGEFAGNSLTYKNPLSGGTSGLWMGDLSNSTGDDNSTALGYADFMTDKSSIVTIYPEGIGMFVNDPSGYYVASTSDLIKGVNISHGSPSGLSRVQISDNRIILDSPEININDSYSLPEFDGTSSQVMTTDGFGNVSWQSVSGGTSGSSIMIEGAASDSTMRDGVGNLTFGTFSTALGGLNNLSNGYAASIAGGRQNNANADYSTVGGGFNNSATTYSSVVAGGDCNTAAGSSSTIGGGTNNSAAGGQSTIAGGGTNTTSGNYSTVAGGSFNTASSNYSTVAGGRFNTASSGYYSVIAGGINNTASGFYSTVGGGRLNTASNSYSTVGGGMDNDANGFSSSVLGGSGNNASGNMSSIIGGCGNTVSGNYSAIIAGQSFTLSASSTVMVPNLIINDQLSFNNIITSSAATIGSGGGLPAINEGFMQVSISGSTYKIPYFNV